MLPRRGRRWRFALWAAAALAALGVAGLVIVVDQLGRSSQEWSEADRTALRGLWIGSLGPLPADPSNRVADDPRAAALGRLIFFDPRFSADGSVSCATCHQPEKGFQDGLPLGVGLGVTARRTMPLAGASYSPWFFWDGRADSQWAQALGPLEQPLEQGGARVDLATLIGRHFRPEYEELFGPFPDLSDSERFPPGAGPFAGSEGHAAWDAMRPEDRETATRVLVNIGKAIAAYERLLVPGPSRFDAYVAALLAGDDEALPSLLTDDEVAGLRLFIGKGECTNCHNGPLLTNAAFHNVGAPAVDGDPGLGRATGVMLLLQSEFTCLGPYSDALPEECGELRFLVSGDERQVGAFKTPSLRNVAERAPYLHAGQLATLAAVLERYNDPPAATTGHSELHPLHLTVTELRQLEAFLRALSGPLATPAEWLEPP